MTHKVFIDGEVGTTGLQIRERLLKRNDIELISLDEDNRKNLDARLGALDDADVGILCLPDAASLEIAANSKNNSARLIDASTAHRVDPNWIYGFAELDDERRQNIASAQFVSNPGCYSTGAISLLHPLTSRGLLNADAPITINAVSGYSGGGKAMIADFKSGQADDFFVYGLGQNHKHIPEIVAYGGVSQRPTFVPSVGNFEQGMIVQIPLTGVTPDQHTAIQSALTEHYANSHFVSFMDADHYGNTINPSALNNTNNLELSVHGDPETGCVVLLALLDNLGKGASGAAVQNLNIMLGLDEKTGL